MLEKQDGIDEGLRMHALMRELFPVCRSLTGNGVRQTLNILHESIPLVTQEVPSGSKIYDWVVPKEWNIRDAYVMNLRGERVINFQENNLHVLNYSIPVRRRIRLQELQEHLYSIPQAPHLIPYATSYYNENWGFCLSENQRRTLKDDSYDVCIDSTLEEGSITYGELYIPGETQEEVVFSTYICHPSLCNDNLSGVVMATQLAKIVKQMPMRRYSYRFIFVPETIGALVWLSRNENILPCIRYGFVLTCVGDLGSFTYKKTRQGTMDTDRVAQLALRESGKPFSVVDFDPFDGSDERQYCSPGFDLPFGSVMKTMYGQFLEYHSSGDDLTFVRPEGLLATLDIYRKIIEIIEGNKVYLNTVFKGEPQLGKRGIYHEIGALRHGGSEIERSVFWMLNFSDGHHSMLDVAEKSGIPFHLLVKAAEILQDVGLLEENE